MNEVLDAAWSMMMTVDDCAEVVLRNRHRDGLYSRVLVLDDFSAEFRRRKGTQALGHGWEGRV